MNPTTTHFTVHPWMTALQRCDGRPTVVLRPGRHRNRWRAKAKLEEARAETAALRSLANGAKVLADNPALARLRLVEALPPGTTLELRGDRD
ncbi:MAG: hypothetical protein ACI379_14530 [Nocardioides sp.]|uniref:hypothetical protein n=1 Tax=Nocardioides sp. TaxID=35761 RepID=UPI003F1168BE